MTSQEIYEKVAAALDFCLGIDPTDVHLDANIFEDLGAESIDMLSLTFELEKRCGISLLMASDHLPDNVTTLVYFDKSGKRSGISAVLKPGAKSAVEERLSWYQNAPELTEGETTYGSLFTVNFLCALIAHKKGAPWDPSQVTIA